MQKFERNLKGQFDDSKTTRARVFLTMALMMMMMGVARAEIGASSVGTGFYEACLAFHTTTNKVFAHAPAFIMMMIRGDVKYYFADFVCKRGGPPKSVTFF